MTSVPQTPDGKHIAVAKLVGAGFKPALVPQARWNAIASMRQAVAQAGGVFKQNRRPNSDLPELGNRASFDDIRSPRDGAARGTSPRRGEVNLLARSQRNTLYCGRWRIDPTSAGACLRCRGLQLALPGER